MKPVTMSGKMVKTSMRTAGRAAPGRCAGRSPQSKMPAGGSTRTTRPPGSSPPRRPRIAGAPARPTRARADRWPGWPPPPPPVRARRPPASTTCAPTSSCTHSAAWSSPWSASRLGSAVRTAPASASAASRVATPAKATIHWRPCGLARSTVSGAVPACRVEPASRRDVSVGDQRHQHLAAQAVGPRDAADLELGAGISGHRAGSVHSPADLAVSRGTRCRPRHRHARPPSGSRCGWRWPPDPACR